MEGENMIIVNKPLHKRFVDLENRKFVRLNVIGYAGKNKKHQYWWCECDCGNIKKISASALYSENTISCGCYNKQKASKHLMSKYSEYRAYAQLKIDVIIETIFNIIIMVVVELNFDLNLLKRFYKKQEEKLIRISH